jgi:hypothetical protein
MKYRYVAFAAIAATLILAACDNHKKTMQVPGSLTTRTSGLRFFEVNEKAGISDDDVVDIPHRNADWALRRPSDKTLTLLPSSAISSFRLPHRKPPVRKTRSSTLTLTATLTDVQPHYSPGGELDRALFRAGQRADDLFLAFGREARCAAEGQGTRMRIVATSTRTLLDGRRAILVDRLEADG